MMSNVSIRKITTKVSSSMTLLVNRALVTISNLLLKDAVNISPGGSTPGFSQNA